MTGWLWLLTAGAVEIAWAQSIPPTRGLTRFWPTVLCLALCLAVIWLLAKAAQELPMSTVYVVFTGIGATGAVALGLVVHHDPLTPVRLAAIGLITGGVLLAHAAQAQAMA